MLGVGIHENIYIAGVTLDDKAVININFKEVAKAGEGPKKSLFARAASSEVEEVDEGITIRLFPPTPPKPESEKTQEQKVTMLVADINKVKGICLHILKGYYTSEQLKDAIIPFASTTLSEENFNTEIQKKEVLEAVQRNIGRVFVEMMKPHVDDPKKAFRLLLIRQSTDKHFATLRGRFLDDQPFWEGMDVPLAQTKLKFSDWEIANGYNSGIPSAKPEKKGTDISGGTTGPAPQSAASVFGGG